MALLLARIDDRLVHGQVVIGCCEPLQAERVLLVDDLVAEDALQRQLFAIATPPGIELEVLRVAQASERLRELARTGEDAATILVVRACETMLTLVRASGAIDAVNVGGLHVRSGSSEVWPGFHLTAADRRALAELVGLGVRVRVQAVPGAPSVEVGEDLAEGTP